MNLQLLSPIHLAMLSLAGCDVMFKVLGSSPGRVLNSPPSFIRP
jgi:hypothetical protein